MPSAPLDVVSAVRPWGVGWTTTFRVLKGGIHKFLSQTSVAGMNVTLIKSKGSGGW